MSQFDELNPGDRTAAARIQSLPPGPGQVRAAEEFLAQARTAGEFAWEFVARDLLSAAQHHEPSDLSHLEHLAWLRGVLRGRHELGPGDRAVVLWRVRWEVGAALRLPEVPLSDIESLLEEMDGLYRRFGVGLRPVLGLRATLAADRGDQDAVRRLLASFDATPRDSLSDCAACEVRETARALIDHDPDAALIRMQPVLDGVLECADEPAQTLSHAALAAVDLGDPGRAVAWVREGWRHSRGDDPELAQARARLLIARTALGEVELAMPVWRQEWARTGSVSLRGDSDDRLIAAATGALVLNALIRADLAPDQWGERSTAQVRDEWHHQAQQLAQRFDERVGSSVRGDRLARWLDLSRIPSPAPRARPWGGAPPGAMERLLPVGAHAARLRQSMEVLSSRTEHYLESWRSVRSRLIGSTGPEEQPDLLWLERVSARGQDPARTRVQLDHAAELADRLDCVPERLRIEVERALLAVRDGDAEPGGVRARIRQIAEELEDRGEWLHAGSVWRALVVDLPGPDSATCARRAAAAARHEGSVLRQVMAELDEARIRAGQGRRAEAHRLLDAAEGRGCEHPWLRAAARDLRARLLSEEGDLEGAERAWHEALTAEIPVQSRVASRVGLAELLAAQGRWEQVGEQAELLRQEALANRDPGVLALGHQFLGAALVESGRPLEGAELLEAALPVLQERSAGFVGAAAFTLGRALLAIGDPVAARSASLTATAAFASQGRHAESTHCVAQAELAAQLVGADAPEGVST